MRTGDRGAIFNDGKVGVAYQEELQFAVYVRRLQGHVETVLDTEFKNYIRKSNITIDETLYRIRLPEPTNFHIYRQQEVDAALLSSYGTADSVPYMSKRFIMERYLQLTDEEIATNEVMLREEKGIEIGQGEKEKDDLPMLYNAEETMAAMEGGDLGGEEMTAGDTGGDTGGDLEL